MGYSWSWGGGHIGGGNFGTTGRPTSFMPIARKDFLHANQSVLFPMTLRARFAGLRRLQSRLVDSKGAATWKQYMVQDV